MKAYVTVPRPVALYNQSPWSWVFLSNRFRRTVGHVTEIPPRCLQLLTQMMPPCWKVTEGSSAAGPDERPQKVTCDPHHSAWCLFCLTCNICTDVGDLSAFLITVSSSPEGWGVSCLADLQLLFLVGCKSKPVCWSVSHRAVLRLHVAPQPTINKGGVLYQQGNK